VRLDRWNLQAGTRLWEQIASFISDPSKCDAWLVYATQESLASEACREELAYALDRALNSRDKKFPLIGLFPSTVDHSTIPAPIRIRLFVSLTDPDWKERIVASVRRRDLAVTQDALQPFVVQLISPAPVPFRTVIEMRPRAGVWNPFVFAIPVGDKDRLDIALRSGPPRRIPPLGGVVFSKGEGPSGDGKWHCIFGHEPASPTHSYFAFSLELPSSFGFGQEGAYGKIWFVEGARIGSNEVDLSRDVGPVNVRA
jgi:hypothetical protein